VIASFLLAVIYVSAAGWAPATGEAAVSWLRVGNLDVDLGLRLDPLSLLMTLVVTGVASAIHVYSIGYMREDRSFPRFFASLSFFTFSMLGIVLATNFVQLFLFWELVGVSSYLLIGFWFERASAADAAKKAFLTNRLGDFGFLLGVLMLWSALGSLNFHVQETKLAADPGALGTLATAAGLLIFCGAIGKSAQFPLHVWLPDAMEGPTPVSALIHAATMVAAGVYMLCRVRYALNAPALEVISYVGGFTALLAAVIAVQQDDIKRILAYSTISQLGYMVMAVGLGGPTAAMFHLTTHAFFKALLFLGAGSVILAVHHEQDIWKMGGLRRKMPVTFWTFLFGMLALCGVPPFSGFYSKDGIFAQALAGHHYALFALALFVAVLTPFYMFRLFFVVFLGGPRTEAAGHAHESPPVMAWPLRVLAVFSLIGGVIGANGILDAQFGGETAGPALTWLQRLVEPWVTKPGVALIGLAAAAAGFALAAVLYARAASDPLPAKLGRLAAAMRNRFYFDEIYEATVIRLHDFLAAVADWMDRWLIAGLGVRGLQGTTEFAGRALRLMQTGNLQTYALVFGLGVAVILYCLLGK
jgi:NADH-quinone oxidoreductase subunit L